MTGRLLWNAYKTMKLLGVITGMHARLARRRDMLESGLASAKRSGINGGSLSIGILLYLTNHC